MTNKSLWSGNPYDTPISSGLRLLVEIIAWVVGPWAVAQQSIWLAIPAVVILVGLPAVFSTPGDKKQIVVPTPGPVRLLIEFALYGAAVAGAWIAWPIWASIPASVIVAVALITGIPRSTWLLRGH